MTTNTSTQRGRWTVFPRPAPATPTPLPWPQLAPLAGPRRRPPDPDPWARAGIERADRSGAVLSGRYELLRRVGAGGMADVYAARFLASRRKVAVKLLDPLLAGDLELVARFRHEFLILTRVRHPNLIQAMDMAVSAAGQPYFTLPLIGGPSLERRLQTGGRLPAARVIELGRQLCGAAAALHRAGVIHRDIKPSNVLLAERRDAPDTIDARLIDLGIAWLSPDYYADTDPYMTPPAARVATRRGQLLGTPGYTPPEAGGGPSAPTRDVFALGVLLYRALTGHMPFAAPYRVRDGQAPRPFAALGLAAAPPPALEEVLLAALSPDPRARLPSAQALAQELECAAELLDRDDTYIAPLAPRPAFVDPRGADDTLPRAASRSAAPAQAHAPPLRRLAPRPPARGGAALKDCQTQRSWPAPRPPATRGIPPTAPR
ncbi:MAG: serine/threonine-protein kinase [Nannocystaceae bacterium]